MIAFTFCCAGTFPLMMRPFVVVFHDWENDLAKTNGVSSGTLQVLLPAVFILKALSILLKHLFAL